MKHKVITVFEAEGNRVLFQGSKFYKAESNEKAKELADLFKLAYSVGRKDQERESNIECEPNLTFITFMNRLLK